MSERELLGAIVRYRRWIYLVFILAAGCSLAGPALRSSRLFDGSTKETDYVCEFDSFSEPAMAEAVIQKEGERLFRAFVQTRDIEAEADSRVRLTNRDEPDSVRRGCGGAIFGPEMGRLSKAQLPNLKRLECLSTHVQQLKSDVDRKLLAIYCELGLWNEFTDRYLEFLREAPSDSHLVDWALFALGQAEQVGRASEVAEALQEAIRTNGHGKTAKGLRDALEMWIANGSHRVTGSNP